MIMHFSAISNIINEVPKSHHITIQNAAEISKLVTDRTLGPDKPLWKDDEQARIVPTSTDSTLKDLENNLNSKLTEEKTNSCLTTPNSLQGLDFPSLNSSILLRDAEQQRRKSIRKQVIDMLHRHRPPTQQPNINETAHQRSSKENWFLKVTEEAERQTAEEVRQYEAQMNEIRKQAESKLVQIAFQGVSQHQQKFRGKYEIVAKLLLSVSQQELLSCTEYNNKLKDLIQRFDELLATLRSGVCGPSELRAAESLCNSLDELEASVIRELENIIKREQEKAEIYNDEQKRIQQQEQEKSTVISVPLQQNNGLPAQGVIAATINESTTPSEVPSATTSTSNKQGDPNMQVSTLSTPAANEEPLFKCTSQERVEFYTKIITKYHEKVEKVKPLQNDVNMKKYRSACQKAINIPVNAISNVSPQFLQDKFEKLYNFFAGEKLQMPEGNISVNDHPLGRDYCILSMAKKFVSQGDSAISSNPQAAFPFASVIVSLWKHIPEFGEIYLAYTFKESPFLVPYFIAHQPGQPVEEYYKMCGYRITNGQMEDHDKYLKRQAGIARLYAAVMITNGRQADGNSHPYGIDHAWRWLANIVSLEPLPDICATLVLEMLQIFGANLLETFGKQFIKLLFYIQQYYFPKLSAVDEGGPKARLEELLGKYLTKGVIPKPKGILPPGFW